MPPSIIESPVEIEQLSLNAWPSSQTYLYGGMVVRRANGYTKRANSATVLFDATWTAEKQRWVEQFYGQHQQPAIFRLLSFNGASQFDERLKTAGYEKIDLTHVMTCTLDQANPDHQLDHRCQILPLDAWLEIFHTLDQSKLGDQKKQLHHGILEQIPGRLCPMILAINKKPVACGLGVLDGGAVGLFDIVTGEAYRQKGYGSALIHGLLDWGRTHGAMFSFLQVMAQNEPAINLYVKKGFKRAYFYWYRKNAR